VRGPVGARRNVAGYRNAYGTSRPRAAYGAVRVPPPWLEYAYYIITAYSLLSASVGLEVPLVAASLTLALAFKSALHLRSVIRLILAPVSLLIGCLVSFVLVQVVVHGIPVTDPTVRLFVLWGAGIVILQTLQLRPGFVRRCTLVIFGIGLLALPGLILGYGGSVERAKAGMEIGGNLQNANGLGGWFGFCLVSLAMLGLQTNRLAHRVLYWTAAAASLLIAGLSVSRGALLASAIAITFGLRGVLKRGLVPLLLLASIAVLVSYSGLFGHIVSLYEERGMEETGRLLLWPHVLERVVSAPFVGFSIVGIATYIPEQGRSISTPHNSFLFFALAAGIVPVLFWTAFWIRTGWSAFSCSSPSGSGRTAFFLYLFINAMLGDIGTPPWFVMACAIAAGTGSVRLAAPLPHPLGLSRRWVVPPRLIRRTGGLRGTEALRAE